MSPIDHPSPRHGVVKSITTMTWRWTLLSMLGCAGCAGTPRPEPDTHLVKGFPALPDDAREVVERLALCRHFAGETGDNPPERERQIGAAVTRLRCDRIEQDVIAIRARYAGNAEVAQALAAADEF